MQERLWSGFFTERTAAACGIIGDALCADDKAANPCVSSLVYDSREAEPGAVYFALPGLHADGHDFIEDALRRGAVVIVHEKPLAKPVIESVLAKNALFVRVKDARRAMSAIAASFYGYPSRRLCVIGVTGTEGKSTTVSLIWQLLRLLGEKAGFISTVEHSEGGEAQPAVAHQTTPEAVVIQRRLAEMLENGCRYAVLEASSHGLSPRTARLADVDFDVGVMTNVTHEHLEFHGTWEQYRDDKANLFRAASRFCVLNAADPSAAYFAEAAKVPVYGFAGGMGNGKWEMGAEGAEGAVLRVTSLSSTASGNTYTVTHTPYPPVLDCVFPPLPTSHFPLPIQDRLPGAFNAGNVLGALIVVSRLLGKPIAEIAPLVPRLKPVLGRMTVVDRGQDFEVIVDYAHTPSSFSTIFPSLRSRCDGKNARLIAVFGSAGERDTQKRPQQGKIAADFCDFLVLTDEDPRGEEPLSILEEISAGVLQSKRPFEKEKTLFLIPEREAAIKKAFSLAKKSDIVLLLGKGHENTIIYSRPPRKTIPWNEIGEAEKALAEMGFGNRVMFKRAA